MMTNCVKKFRSFLCFEWPERLLYIRAILVIIGGFTVNLTLSTMFTFGNMEPYIVSYIRNQSHPTNLRMTISPWVFTATVAGQGTAVLVGGWLYSKLGPRVTTLIGGWTLSSGVLLSYFTIQTSFWLFILTYGVMVGIGIGIAYVSPLSVAMKWMPNWKGVANGIMMAGYGIGILMFDTIQTTFSNPNNCPADTSSFGHKEENYFTDPQILNRIPYTFLVLGGTYAVLQLLGSLLLTDPPEHYLQEEIVRETELYGTKNYRAVDDENCIGTRTCSSVTAKQTKRKKKSFMSKFLCQFKKEKAKSWSASNPALQQSDSTRKNLLLKDENCDSDNQSDQEREKLLRDSVEDDQSNQKERGVPSDIVSSVTAEANVIVSLRPLQMLKQLNFYLLWFMFMLDAIAVNYVVTYYKVFGFITIADDHFLGMVGAISALCDTAGCIVWGLLADKLGYKIALVILNATMTVFLLTFYASSVAGKPMFMIWVCILWFCLSGFFAIYPTAVARSFGLKYVSTNYPFLFTSQIIASIITSLIATFLYDYITVYGTMFLVSGLTFLSFVLIVTHQPKRYITFSVTQFVTE